MPMTKAILTYSGTSTTFDVWNGKIERLQNEGSYFKRLGQKGTDNQILGQKASDSICLGQIYLNETTGKTLRATLYTIKDTLVKFTDPFGEEFPRLWVKAINTDLRAISGMGQTHCLVVNIVMELQP